MENRKTFAVAIDGPSGAGKSTLARSVARELGAVYVDTGAIYRTVGYGAWRQGIDPEAAEKICALLKGLLEKGVPIDGFGMQGHWNVMAPSLDEIRRSIEAYASLGLKLQITEMDLSLYAQSDPTLPQPGPAPAELVKRQTELYGDIFRIFREYKDVIQSVTFWGVADDDTWLDRFFKPHRANHPLLFDENHQPKEAFRAVVDF